MTQHDSKQITTTYTHSRNNLSVLVCGYAKISLCSIAEKCTLNVSNAVMERELNVI